MDIAIRPFELELASPLETADGRIDRREGFLVRVEDGDDSGLGEATPLPGWTESYEACRDALERVVSIAGEDGATDTLLAACEDAPAARHGLALALADLHARRELAPLYRQLDGCERVDYVPVNATIGDGSPAETADAAGEAVADGYDTIKLKVGVRDVAADLERVRRVREAVGPEIELRVDANGAWTPAEARTAIEGLADEDVALLEQPLPAEDLAGHATLRGSGVAIGLDEGLLECGIDTVLGADAADAIVVKPMALGGPDRAREVAAWALECDVVPIVTTTIDAVVARTGAVHLAASLPDVPACGLATADLLATDLGPDPAPVIDGEVVVPGGNGLGVSGVWDE
ncbi:o-succinylbenzoate synthase [Natrialbaceae archaeon AArc-T1-2]|uniref:o-succinylbenzoate synthase n=1 Tax=Natrialbaceae archaeon AArc-T1-2 TaxID=3053904 RepID=UPI00255ACA0D|nr:o-succinylbenzoate synthase [Natrialbaceae archaeon AArc-T1-2]WIV66137.1 o-succinylbenzoate synthase [Natrialbaceae archaeon AArc-T1-2]